MVKAIDVLDKKEQLIGELEQVNKELLNATIQYKEIQSNLWLDTDFGEILQKGRPTVDEKKAYVTLHSLEYREKRENAIYKKEVLLKAIELCDDKLRVCDE